MHSAKNPASKARHKQSHAEFASLNKRRKTIRIILVVAIIFFTALNFPYLRKALVLGFFIFLNILVGLIKRSIPFGFIKKYFFGFELILICTAASGVRYGPSTGAIMGLILMAVNYISENRASEYFPVTMVLYTLIGYFSFYFSSVAFVALGISLTIIYNILAFALSKAIGANTATLAIFCLVNIISNIFLFYAYGNFFLFFLN